ncbi:nuclear apoptosis-inducing factor 1-like [Lepisosteus oculatus]|uniref:nuclear apoptosis-inducing factor 1-like n=1 Tax=Lepisosteus oculatus TaxID=7918 RepID=UPI00074017D6|nr:PREDICTED: uncharacterized protein LOC107075803 [Lepisosteus oculatus]
MAERKRNPNWTEEEKAILLKEYSRRKEILTSKFNPAVTSVIKQKHWKEITDCVNSQNPTVKRTIQEVKKKYENLSTAAKKEYRELRKAATKRAPQEPSQLSGPSPLQTVSVSSSPALPPRIVAVSSFVLPTSRPQAPLPRPPLLVPRPRQVTPVLQPPRAVVSSSADVSSTPRGMKELGNFGEELDRIHSAITNCGDRIVAAIDPIASSLHELTHHLGSLVDLLGRQPSPPCHHTAIQTSEDNQEESNIDNTALLIVPKVEKTSPSYPSTSSTQMIQNTDDYR